jgi:hypothetical protein
MIVNGREVNILFLKKTNDGRVKVLDLFCQGDTELCLAGKQFYHLMKESLTGLNLLIRITGSIPPGREVTQRMLNRITKAG